jgi:hypothetical protein
MKRTGFSLRRWPNFLAQRMFNASRLATALNAVRFYAKRKGNERVKRVAISPRWIGPIGPEQRLQPKPTPYDRRNQRADSRRRPVLLIQ